MLHELSLAIKTAGEIEASKLHWGIQRYYLTGPEAMQKTTANSRTYTDGKIHIYTDLQAMFP